MSFSYVRSLLQRLLPVLLIAVAPRTASAQDGPAPSDVDMPSFDGEELEAATLSYEFTTSRNGQSSTHSLTVTISQASHDGTPTWRVVNESARRGASTDVLHVDRSTLFPVLHRTKGGPFDLVYDGGTITGTVGTGPNATSIDTTVSGPVLDEKSLNLDVALAGASLKEGKTFLVRSFSPLGPAVHVVECSVTGTKTVEVPAGTFETYVVSTTPMNKATNESGTLYLRTSAPHYVIEGEANIEMGGMSMTTTRTLTALK